MDINEKRSPKRDETQMVPQPVKGESGLVQVDNLIIDVRIDNELRLRLAIGRELKLFPRLFVFGSYKYQMDFG